MRESDARRDEGRASAPVPTASLTLAVGVAFAIGLCWRMIGTQRVFWFDEVFTGAIALQPKLSILIDDCLNELSGPGYYGFAWLWGKAFGVSDFALRVPSFLFSIATPVLVLWRGHPDKIVRLVWAASIAVLHVCAFFAWEARSYSLLLLLGAIQTILFASLVRRPSSAAAYGWAIVALISAFTHYFTVPMTGLQWLALVAVHRRKLGRYWPAMLLFIPFPIWFGLHFPFLARFAGIAWQPPVRLHAIVETCALMFGAGRPVFAVISALIFMVVATSVWDARRGGLAGAMRAYDPADLLATACAIGAVAAILVYGAMRPSYSPRYIIPMMPALLLALAVWARRMVTVWPGTAAALTGFFAIGGALLAYRDWRLPDTDIRTKLEWQTAATAMMAQKVRHVAFLWDAGIAVVPSAGLSRRTAGFFFDRARQGIRTTAVVLAGRNGDPDPNSILPSLLDRTRRSNELDGFIWIYIPNSPAASRHPARFEELARRFRCAKYVDTPDVTTLGCIRREQGGPA